MNHFNQIAEALRKQKQLMDQLEAENRQLRQELASLRSGAGISVEIDGIRFPLKENALFLSTPAS